MVTKEQKTKRRRITALLATCALAIAAIAGVSFFGGSASAAANNSSAEYGEQLKDEAGLAGQGYSFLSSEMDDYFGTVGDQKFVVTDNNNKYAEKTISVNARKITPTVKLGSYSGNVADYSGKAESSATLNKSSVFISEQGGKATVEVTNGTVFAVGTSNAYAATVTNSGNVVTIEGGTKEANNTTAYIVCKDSGHKAILKTVAVETRYNPLPSASGQIAYMTIEDLYKAMGGNVSTSGTRYDPGNSSDAYGSASQAGAYTTSKYFVYGIDGYSGSEYGVYSTDTALTGKGASAFPYTNTNKDYGYSSSGQFNYAAYQSTTDNGNVFGGPLNYVNRHGDGAYSFNFWYTEGNSYGSVNHQYWYNDVPASTWVAVVHR